MSLPPSLQFKRTFTEGPWQWVDQTKEFGSEDTLMGKDAPVCDFGIDSGMQDDQVCGSSPTDEDKLAIGALPDLFMACKSAMGWLEYCNMCDVVQYQQLLDAMNKATGQNVTA